MERRAQSLSFTMRWLVSLVIAVASAGPAAVPASSATSPALSAALPPIQPAQIVSLLGDRSELWIADDQAVLHFASDTRALAGRQVDWSYRLLVSPEHLHGLPLGEPWLSTAFVMIENAIYLPRWQTTDTAPVLYHVPSEADLVLMGVTGENRGALVLAEPVWDQRFGFRARSLTRVSMPSLTGAPAVPLPPLAAPSGAAPQGVPREPAAPPAAPATGPVATPPQPARTLSRVPQLGPGGDVSFALPPNRGWSEASGARASIIRLMPTGTLQGERPLALWRLVGMGGAYVYVEAVAVDLNFHPDATTAEELLALKLRFLRNDSDRFEAGQTQRLVVGGEPAVTVETTATRRFPEDERAPRYVSAADVDRYVTQQVPGSPITELTWRAQTTTVIRGNWGYLFRLYSTSPGQKGAYQPDFDQLLAGLTFHY